MENTMSASKLALLGGTPVGPVSPGQYPHFSQEAVDRVAELLQQGTTVGLNKNHPQIAEAERAISEWQGVPYCLGTSSGHAALHSALVGLEVSSGDEVITTPYTWGASISCILHNNAVPVFADVDPETGLLDPASIESCITPKTKAILVVHIYGQPANMTAIRAITDRHGLVIVEDGSQAHGAVHRGRKVGQFGDAAGFSCMGGKLLATSEAGYMVTPHEQVYWKAAMAGQHMGRSPESDFPDALRPYVDSLVYTYRLNPINAVLLAEQVKKIDDENEARRLNVAAFRAAMEGVRSVSFPSYPEGDMPTYHMVTMNFQPQIAGVRRDTYVRALWAEGISIGPYVPAPIPQWRRLDWQEYDGPKVMWTETLRQSGIDYSQTQVPNCEFKVAHSLELGWNYVEVDERKMDQMASAFEKVEENLDALRAWESAT
jgi:dTDP-4-amino-4,6-dideoxygalactose transaminase